MSDTETLERPKAASTFTQAATDADGATAISPYTDFQRKHYVDMMVMMRGRVLEMVGKVRDGEIQLRHAKNGLRANFLKSSFGIFTDGISSIMSFRNPWKLAMWAVNTANTIFDLVKEQGNFKRGLPGFERTQDGLLFTLRTALHVKSLPAPTNADGSPIFVEDPLLAPNPYTGNALDRAFVAKYIPEFLPDKFKRPDVDKNGDGSFKEVPLRQMLYPQHPKNQM